MQRLGWVGPGFVALLWLAHAPTASGQLIWSADPFGTDRKVSPAPQVPWQPTQPLPQVAALELAPQAISAAPLTLPELTEYALRNNPRARQAWFGARAAAAGIGVEQADQLPTITGALGVTRIRPISGTTGAVSPPQSRYGPSLSLSYILFDMARVEQIEAA